MAVTIPQPFPRPFENGIRHPDLYLWDAWSFVDSGRTIHLYSLAVSRTKADGSPLLPVDRNSFPFHIRHFTSDDDGVTWSDRGSRMAPRDEPAMPDALIQFLGSLAAILGLAGLAAWLKLGGAPTLDDDHAVRRAVAEGMDAFEPVAIARDADGCAALARDRGGRLLLVAPHGNKVVTRLLGSGASASLDGDTITVRTGERVLRPVDLDLGDDAQAWFSAIRALS